MKKKNVLLLAVAIVAMAFIACGNNSSSTSSKALTTEILTDSVESHKGGLHYFSAITMDFPSKGNPLLVSSILEWMADRAETSDSVDFTSATDFMKDFNKRNEAFFKETFLEDYMDEGATISDEDTPEGSGVNMSRDIVFEKVFEDDRFVTYTVKEDVYLNGAHGVYYHQGATFRKSDGRRFGFDMLKSSERDSILSLIMKNLENYFEVKSRKELKDCLALNEYEETVSLPQNPPYLIGDTLMFVYQQYEIAAYAYGLPEAAIPLKDLKGLLSPSFQRMLNK